MAKEQKKQNKFTRDAEAKKQARMNQGAKKAKTDRMEKIYLQLSAMSNEDIEARLEEIKRIKEPLEKKMRALYTKFGPRSKRIRKFSKSCKNIIN